MKYYSFDSSDKDKMVEVDFKNGAEREKFLLEFLLEYEKEYFGKEYFKFFLHVYDKAYKMEGGNAGNNIDDIKGCCVPVEMEMEHILEEGIKEPKDVIRILAWKTGKIDHKATWESCEKIHEFFKGGYTLKEVQEEVHNFFDKKSFTYIGGWNENECKVQLPYQKEPVKISEFAETVKKIAKSGEPSEAEDILDKLVEKSVNGIGTVYLITILYFITKGRYPIYDEFALIALMAIKHEIKKEGIAVFTELPDKSNIKNAFGKYDRLYVDTLKEIFGDIDEHYGKNRRLDRALWAYGHIFKFKAKMNLSSYEDWLEIGDKSKEK